ncbi:Uncharacterised protein [Vibrio cholerae]|nr:Uncharacterised protein [Vibrio cholerae]CSH93946.1 Uncharacterised protein [Vibrio cholerae]
MEQSNISCRLGSVDRWSHSWVGCNDQSQNTATNHADLDRSNCAGLNQNGNPVFVPRAPQIQFDNS